MSFLLVVIVIVIVIVIVLVIIVVVVLLVVISAVFFLFFLLFFFFCLWLRVVFVCLFAHLFVRLVVWLVGLVGGLAVCWRVLLVPLLLGDPGVVAMVFWSASRVATFVALLVAAVLLMSVFWAANVGLGWFEFEPFDDIVSMAAG